ncbi:SWIM zinc finger family protein [Micromonospora sp. C95]|uniref:SWIM zinc finger family protein n=1 Tax=Micromonospora sp. C95 TaxID=2824882 RepID=UPI001B366861|nr:SWIM zinc finger family protein [Micromonospora sp. C95]MBQ1025455.1 SWIM zinc finger family protein [Micromonospora sp. C95]
MSADRFADYGPPRRVDGGLRARSTRGAIGVSWWSRRFLEVLESFALGTRLTRGRSYARAGQVLRLDVAPGVVTAMVQGSRAKPYRVSVALPPFPARLWARIEQELAAQAFFSARLLAGDLPAELEELFDAAEAPLFPAAVDELDQRCSCPDVAVPCKHLAATFYLLAEAFDADPFTLLHWRGRSRTDLLTRLRQLRSGTSGADASAGRRTGGGEPAVRAGAPAAGVEAPARDVAAPPEPTRRRGRSRTRDTAPTGTDQDADGGWPGQPGADVPAAGALRALADLPGTPLAEAVDRFWLPPVPLPDRPPSLTARPDLLLRQLGAPAPAIGGPGLVERLRHAYRQLGDQADVPPSGSRSVPDRTASSP